MTGLKALICTVLALVLFTGSAGAAQIPDTSAVSAVLMDADSGRILYAKNADEPRLIASITKLMTALVALESGHSPDEVVTVRQEWTGIEGSSLYLRTGGQLRLETLLYGMLLRSGNDAAHAVAGYCGGDIETFVAAMNAKAEVLGMENSHFANPSGLNAQEHYSTARDMAILARACLADPTLRTVVGTKSIALEGRIFTNHNKLLWQYEGCIGLKTGYTEKAGRTLVSAARRNGMTLICVTLSAPNDWQDHTALFDYGFGQYERRCLADAGEGLCRVPVSGTLIPFCTLGAQESVWAAVAADEQVRFTAELNRERLTAPVSVGDAAGEGVFSLDGQEIARCPLVVMQDIPKDTAPAKTGIFH